MDTQLETILNSLEDAILGIDESSTVVLLNAAAGSIFGCAPAQAIGQSVANFPRLHAAVKELELGRMEKGTYPDRSVRRLQLHHKGKDAPLPMEAIVSRAMIEGRNAFIAVIRDVSFQQQMEKAVYESRKTQALGALASGIAHDFNNVLAAVISQIDLALHAPEFPATLKDHLIYAQTSARRGAELVSKLQAFSRQSNPVLESLDVVEVVDQVVFMLRRSIDPNVAIRFSKSSQQTWLVKADSSHLMQALLNLGINARDAMPGGGSITITTENVSFSGAEVHPPRKQGEHVRLMVADTGEGMTPEVASRVFEPYFTTKDLSRGPGLGLSITSAVVAEHSGWMEVESKVGEGSKFSIFLPRHDEPLPAPKRVTIPDTKAMEGKERVLVVDDEELVRMVTKAVLAYRGYEVVEAEDGEDAVAKYSEAPTSFDLILMDQHMPRLNGYDALQQIRRINPKARAIMLSGGMQEPGGGIGELADVAFLHKPYENQELLRVVRQLLDTP